MLASTTFHATFALFAPLFSSPHSRAGGVSSEMVKAAYNYCQRVSAAVQCLEITAQLTKTAAPVNSILELVNQFQGFEMNRDDENEFQVSEYKRELINSQTRAAIVESDLRSSLAKAEADKDALEKRVIDLMAEVVDNIFESILF